MDALRQLREAAGLTQNELAARAGVSRQLVGATENGRHLPRVDAALALARVLDTDVVTLFGAVVEPPVDVVTGRPPPDGALVRVGNVRGRAVTAPARIGSDGFDLADGRVEGGAVVTFGRSRPGLVVAGCEPGLEIIERLLRLRGMAAVAVSASTAVAWEALEEGRVHAAVVHGPVGDLPSPSGLARLERFNLCRWVVGLAATPDARTGWWEAALGGDVPVIQRERGAGVQRAFERAIGFDPVEGPRVGSHLTAVRHALATGIPAVTIEPAAAALGATFHPLEQHEAQVWFGADAEADGVVDETVDLFSDPPFAAHLGAVGGYDLSLCGERLS